MSKREKKKTCDLNSAELIADFITKDMSMKELRNKHCPNEPVLNVQKVLSSKMKENSIKVIKALKKLGKVNRQKIIDETGLAPTSVWDAIKPFLGTYIKKTKKKVKGKIGRPASEFEIVKD